MVRVVKAVNALDVIEIARRPEQIFIHQLGKGQLRQKAFGQDDRFFAVAVQTLDSHDRVVFIDAQHSHDFSPGRDNFFG